MNMFKFLSKWLNLDGQLFTFYWAAAAVVAVSYLQSRQNKKAAAEAAELQRGSIGAAIEEERRQFDITQEQFEPFREAGVRALSQQEALTGLGGAGAQEEAFATLRESPGQQFIRQRQQRALLQNAAAIGGLGGGNVRTALQEQAAGFAQQDIASQFNRLASLSGTGQTATQNIAALGGQATSNIAGLLERQGQAGASGILGQQQARSQFSTNLAQVIASSNRS